VPRQDVSDLAPFTPRNGARSILHNRRQVRHLISNGYLSLESGEAVAAVTLPQSDVE
jgi:hypothetical protein